VNKEKKTKIKQRKEEEEGGSQVLCKKKEKEKPCLGWGNRTVFRGRIMPKGGNPASGGAPGKKAIKEKSKTK